METQFSRAEIVFGADGISKLQKSHVAVFGLGGVGGYVVEALARSGIGTFTLIDNDKISISNINRQIIALHSTLGILKVEAFKTRIKDINPNAIVNIFDCFYLPDTRDIFDYESFDYIIDAIDTVTAKILLAEICAEKNIPLISSMGAGNKSDPSLLEITDIYKTEQDPLAKVMRRELRKRGIQKLKVVYSKEIPVKSKIVEGQKKAIPGSTAFVPPAAGLLIASEVVKDILKQS